MNLAGLVLAAGESSRMGTPKALLTYSGETFLDKLIFTLSQSCSPVVVVLGRESDRIRDSLSRRGKALMVTNPDPGRGQLSSLQCGLAAVPADADGVIFTPVDHPSVLASTVAAIAQRFGGRELIVVPRSQGKRGHPVCVARELIPEFLALTGEGQARDVIHRHLAETAYVDVEDPGILEDVDDPDAYQRLK